MEQPIQESFQQTQNVSEKNKKPSYIVYIFLLVGFLFGLLSYFMALEDHYSGQFCSTQAFGFPLMVQNRLIIEKVSVQNPTKAQPEMMECLHGPGYPNAESGDIQWLNWFLNIVINVVAFGLVGYLSAKSKYFIILSLVVYAGIWMLARYLY